MANIRKYIDVSAPLTDEQIDMLNVSVISITFSFICHFLIVVE